MSVVPPVQTTQNIKQPPSYSVASKSAKGSVLLLIRQVAVQGMNFCGLIFLARYLSIEDYGFYGIVFFLFAFISNFGDVGLSASLRRQSNEPTIKDYSSVFTTQLVLSTAAAAIFLSLTPLLCKLYEIPSSYSIHFLFISLSLVITVFKMNPTASLERHLDFKWLSVIEIIQAAVYNTMASLMAFYGYGPLSFSLALLCRVSIGTILVNIVKHMPLKLDFNLSFIKNHLSFGLPYQVGAFVNVLKDSISPIIIGLIIGAAHTGMVNMASTIAAFPVMLLAILGRLFFPAFSRAVNDKPLLENLFAMSMRINNAFVAPLAMFILVMAEPFTLYIFGTKWVESETMELWFLLWPANLFLPTLMVCTALLNAFGKSKTVLKYNLVWMLITLGLGTPLIFAFGAKGFGYANIAVNIATTIVAWKMRNYINCKILKEAFLGWLPAISLVWFPLAYRHFFDIGRLHLVLSGVCYYAFATALTYFICRNDIKLIIKKNDKKPTPKVDLTNEFSTQ
ncbi:MAG: oligosaccharide flippase family protein [Chitinispirillales bacterium]|jgi:O-antigen/teichoic acid export membrane protein|nr:oligosaccharide flippase family protein [Chitinispirillales bacterium]